MAYLPHFSVHFFNEPNIVEKHIGNDKDIDIFDEYALM